jgi:DNA-binding PadR family transcriptional regulator
MAIMTSAELAILSVLVEQPRHGYEVEQVIEARGMRDWTEIGFSSIYYLLKKAEAKGWVEQQEAMTPTRGPARTVYRVTRAGRAAWHRAVYEALAVPQFTPSPFLLGLANLPGLAPVEVQQAVAEYQQRLTQRLDQVRSRWEQERASAPDFVQPLFDRSVALLQAESTWIEQFARKYRFEEEIPMPTLEGKALYSAKQDPAIVEIPAARFLTVVGHGSPESTAFQQAVGALYALAYGLKFKLKSRAQEFAVPPLEGLWWAEHGIDTPRELWNWKLLIRMPEFVTSELIDEVRQAVMAKKKAPEIGEVNVERIAEGPVAQALHIGPFVTEPKTIARLHAFIDANGYKAHGFHHEVYLSDFRRTAPEKLKTILRQPVTKADKD